MVLAAPRQQWISAVAKGGLENVADKIISAAINAADVDSKISIAVCNGVDSETNTAAYESSRWPYAVKTLFGF